MQNERTSQTATLASSSDNNTRPGCRSVYGEQKTAWHKIYSTLKYVNPRRSGTCFHAPTPLHMHARIPSLDWPSLNLLALGLSRRNKIIWSWSWSWCSKTMEL